MSDGKGGAGIASAVAWDFNTGERRDRFLEFLSEDTESTRTESVGGTTRRPRLSPVGWLCLDFDLDLHLGDGSELGTSFSRIEGSADGMTRRLFEVGRDPRSSASGLAFAGLFR